jgi:protoporphyrinogen oxidase
VRILVLGAGVAGLAAAACLPRERTRVLEAGPEIGGLCRTVRQGAFRFDRTGHFLHLRHPRTQALVGRLLHGKLERHARRAAIHLDGHWIPHPFQAHLGCLPAALREECLGAFLASRARSSRPSADAANLLEWFQRAFGGGITRHFLEPHNRKTYCRDLRELDAAWAPEYVPLPSAEQVIEGASRQAGAAAIGYNAEFLYPREGGISALPRALAAGLHGVVRCDAPVVEVDARRRTARCASGELHAWDQLVSTIPLNALLAMAGGLPAAVRRAGSALRAVDVLDVRLGIAGPVAVPWHWIYFPEDRFSFVRVVIPSNVSATAAPPGHSAVQVEFNCPEGAALDERQCQEDAARALHETGILPASSRVVSVAAERIRCAYVVHDHQRSQALAEILPALREHGIRPAGRYGAWGYGGMEAAMLEGIAAAEAASLEVDARAQLER